MATSYQYTKMTVNLDRLREDILLETAITKTVTNLTWEEPSGLTIIFDASLATEEKTALDNVVSNHTGDPPRDTTNPNTLEKLLKKVDTLERILVKKIDGMVDDFVDDSGVDADDSVDIAVKPGYVRCADNASSATVITKTIETVQTRQNITVHKHMAEGEGSFQVSADDGETWEDVTTFGEPIALSGKKYKVKATLTGSDKLALLAFEIE